LEGKKKGYTFAAAFRGSKRRERQEEERGAKIEEI
jgi:hypothetical protein